MVIVTLFRSRPLFVYRVAVTLLLFSISIRQQAQSDILTQKVTVCVQDASLTDVFAVITAQTGMRFSYNPDIVDDKSSKSYNIQNKSLDEALGMILPTTIGFKQMGRYVVLAPKKGEPVGSAKLPVVVQMPSEIGEKSPVIPEKQRENILINNEREDISEKKPSSDSGLFRNDCLDSIILKTEEEMKKYLATLALSAATITTSNVFAQDNQATQPVAHTQEASESPASKEKAAQVTFVYPLGSDWVNSANNGYKFSFNVIGGVTGRVHGGEIASVFNINKYSAKGLQLAGAFNLTGTTSSKESSKNVQLAAGFNFTKNGQSTQLAGGANVADTGHFQASAGFNIASHAGAQLAGGFNLARHVGFQASAGFNAASDAACQIAGGINVAKSNHAQISAGINVSSQSDCQITGGVNVTKTGGVQLCAGVNVAKESNCQITAGVNVTKKGGFQLGIINVRDTADGVSLGIINIVAHGGVLEFGLEGGDFLHANATFRSGTQRLYTILSAGGNFSEEFWAFGAGFGTGFKFNNWLGLNLEALYYNLFDYDFSYHWEYNALVQFRPVLNFRIAKHFKLFAGPNFNLLMQNTNSDFLIKAPYTLFDTDSRNINLKGWIGITAGMRF